MHGVRTCARGHCGFAHEIHDLHPAITPTLLASYPPDLQKCRMFFPLKGCGSIDCAVPNTSPEIDAGKICKPFTRPCLQLTPYEITCDDRTCTELFPPPETAGGCVDGLPGYVP